MFCEAWPDLKFLIFTSHIPVMVYYSHIPATIVALLMGIFIFYKNKSLESRLLFFIAILFSIWTSLNIVLWVSPNSMLLMLLWSFIGVLFSAIAMFLVYFVYVFLDKKDIAIVKKIFLFLLFLPVAIFSFTEKNLIAFNRDTCGAIENPLFSYYYYATGAVAFFWILFVLIARYIKTRSDNERGKIIFLGIGVEFFILSFFSASFLNTYLVDNGLFVGYAIEFYGLFGMTFFMRMLAYLIVRFKAFNIRLLGAQVLVFFQFILIGSMLLFARSLMNQIIIVITLALTTIMGWNMVRSVKREIADKEKIEEINVELTERKDELQVMADSLARSNDQLRILDNAKSEFISIASHQLRTPLTAIKGFISLMMEGSYGEVTGKHKEVLNKIYISNERLITLVEDLLNISRIESGRMEFKFDKWDLEKICKEVLDTFALRAKDHDLYLDYKASETPLPELTIDGNKVREVISNLVDNAIKYTLDGHGGVTLKLEQIEDKARITVSDTGIGIPETELPYLFAKFSRGKDISRLNTGGTGLGLYVGKNMIESNGGKIWAESEGAGLGSRFIIEIPLVQTEETLAKWG